MRNKQIVINKMAFAILVARLRRWVRDAGRVAMGEWRWVAISEKAWLPMFLLWWQDCGDGCVLCVLIDAW